MSSRQKTQRKPKGAENVQRETSNVPASTVLQHSARAALILVIAGVASSVSQLNLSPVYGSIPASLHHQRTMTLTAIAALLGRRAVKKYVSENLAQYIAVIAYWTPVIQFLLFPHSEKLGIEYGPLAIEALTYFPLLFLSMYGAADLLDSVDLSRFNLPPSLNEIAVPAASYFTVSSVAKFSSAFLPNIIGTSLYFTRVCLQMLLASVSAFLTPSRVMVLAFPAILHTIWSNPHYMSETGFHKANATLVASQNFTILARQESITGYVSVIENYADNAFRLLRCDHSLLGGEWLVTPEAHARGQRQRETIFSVFVLLEAVRLIEPPSPSTPQIPDTEKSALVIGLGIGTAPNAMIAHGLNTTVVELDPVVHAFATQYFGLSGAHTAVLSDAVSFVSSYAPAHPRSYHYIIHDVFTGGAEPAALFTTEFLTGLSDLLHDDGAIAINYAGDLSLGSTRLVLNTIHAVFPACRIFRDTAPPPSLQPGDPDFINMVVFCVKRAPVSRAGSPVLSFRKPTYADLLGSIARQNFLEPKEELEVRYAFVAPEDGGKTMGRADVGELEKFHEQGAVSHWRIMRSVLPPGVWEMW